jgi:hypothetical protein
MKEIKASIRVQMSSHCAGCGIKYSIALDVEPILYCDEKNFIYSIRDAVETLHDEIPNCRLCKEKTSPVSIFETRY